MKIMTVLLSIFSKSSAKIFKKTTCYLNKNPNVLMYFRKKLKWKDQIAEISLLRFEANQRKKYGSWSQ